MRYTPKERREAIDRAMSCGLSYPDAVAVRRIAMTLRRWYELECGTESGAIEREQDFTLCTQCGHKEWELTGRCVKCGDIAPIRYDGKGFPYFYYADSFKKDGPRRRYRVPDRETGAIKRLNAIMAQYPALRYYLQTDPRGGTLYLIRPGDVPEGKEVDAYYNRGVFVA
jgi:ribosomal protein L37E